MPRPMPTVVSLARDLRSEIEGLPRVSALLAGFFGSADQETAGVDRIVANLRHQPELAAWILRQANSGLYHQQRALRSLTDAAVVLGLEAVTSLTFAACSRPLLLVDPTPYPGSRRSFWLHGLATGCAAAELARILGPRSPLTPDTARLAGLVHDVGKRLVAPRWPRGQEPPCGTMDEHHAVGFDHALASAAVCHHWGLPSRVIAAVSAHHEPNPVGAAALLGAANELMKHWQVGPAVYPRFTDEIPEGRLAAVLGDLAPDAGALRRWAEALPPCIEGLDEMLRWSERPDMPEAGAASPEGELETVSVAGPRSSRSRHRTRGRQRASARGRRHSSSK